MDLASFRCEVKKRRDQIARKRKADIVEDIDSVEENNDGQDELFNFALLAGHRSERPSQESQGFGDYDNIDSTQME